MVASATLTVALMAGLPSGVVAHDPTPLWNHAFGAGSAPTYAFGVWRIQDPPGVYTDYQFPASLQPVFADVIEHGWADPTTNNSNSPRFTRTTAAADVMVYWAPDNPVHQTNGWLGSASIGGSPRKIWMRSNVKTVYRDWCERNDADRCPKLARASIHEIGHVGSLGHNVENSWTATRMHGCMLDLGCSDLTYPFKGTTSWDTTTIGTCDEAALQLRYDVDSHAGPYAKCLDHIPGAGPNGLYTDLTVNAVNVIACPHQTVTISGRLSVRKVQSYGPLSGNVLASRKLRIDRTGGKYHSPETTTGTGDNWRIDFTGANVTYSYVVQWETPTTQGLERPPPRAFKIRWLGPQLLC